MEYAELLKKQKTNFFSGKTLSYEFRKKQLLALRSMITKNEELIINALQKDLNKSEYESYMTEIGFLYAEIDFTVKRLKKWMKPQKVKNTLIQFGSKSYIYKEPYGVTLIIAPWNYPVQLALAPLIGAIAAGNCSVLKPSELTPAVSTLLRDLIKDTFDEDYITVVEGDKDVSQALLDLRFDYIFFTGSVPVGKIVMEQASKHLIPITLELGGKSPAIVDKSAKLELAAKRIAWGKFTNAGQTCIAPDYLYVHEEVQEEFLEVLKKTMKEMYGKDPLKNPNYTHIVSERHFNRLKSFLNDGKVVIGAEVDESQLAISPTILRDISWDDSVMMDEIFGPILPTLSFKNLDDVIEQIRNHEKPLALYFFSEDTRNEEKITKHVSFGGGCINDTLYHIANPYLPFGGVGQSGMGNYHGKASFDIFSHDKAIVKQTTSFDLSFRYPHSKSGLSIIKRILK